jgi:CHAD domain-containing protein
MADATTPVSAALSRVVADQRARLVEAWPAAIRGDAEALRRVRIATRRLRVVADIVRRADVVRHPRRLLRDLRRIGRAFGPARERLVARGDLSAAARRHRWTIEQTRGLGAWIDRGIARETCAMRKAARDVDVDAIGERVAAAAEDIAAVGHDRLWRDRLAAAILRRAARVAAARRHCGALYEPDRLHALRIAIKKLRYLAEIARDVAGGAAPWLPALVREQRRYGRLHDRQGLVAEARALAATMTGERAARIERLIAVLDRDCRRWHAAAIASLGAIDAAVAEARTTAATLVRASRPVRANLPPAALRRHHGH